MTGTIVGARVGPEMFDFGAAVLPDRAGDVFLTAPPVLKRALAMTAYTMWRESGYPSGPSHIRLCDRLRSPRPGDLCFVPDALRGDDDDDRFAQGFGYLVVARTEPHYTAEQWARVGRNYLGEPCPADAVFYIQHAGDGIARWENATCLVIAHTEAIAAELRE